jgi:hypothetical protein
MRAEPGHSAGEGREISAPGEISGIASIGDGAVNVQYSAEQMTALSAEAFGPLADLPASGLVSLPGRAGLFVGRAGKLSWPG